LYLLKSRRYKVLVFDSPVIGQLLRVLSKSAHVAGDIGRCRSHQVFDMRFDETKKPQYYPKLQADCYRAISGAGLLLHSELI
jgi:hypothetical protein